MLTETNAQKKIQHIEYDFLAPDSVNEIFHALDLLKKHTAKAINNGMNDEALLSEGERLLNDPGFNQKKIEIYADGFEAANRPTQIIKVKEAYEIYKRLIVYYGAEQLIAFINRNNISSFEELINTLPDQSERSEWVNIGGQLLPKQGVNILLENIRNGEIKNWNEVHQFYQQNAKQYADQKLQHSFASLMEILSTTKSSFTAEDFSSLLHQALNTKKWMVENIYESRAKDYQSEFRLMVYDNKTEMENVIGKLDDNVFINQQKEELSQFKKTVEKIGKLFSFEKVNA